MIDTKFKNADDKTSLQALWIEVEKADKLANVVIAGLQAKVEILEEARQIQRRLNEQFTHTTERVNSKLTTPEKKSIWDFFLKRK